MRGLMIPLSFAIVLFTIISVSLLGGRHYAASNIPDTKTASTAKGIVLPTISYRDGTDPTVYLVDAQDGHQYVVATRIDAISIVHAAGCKACSKEIEKQ